jgi:hypothetical protein
MGVLDQPLIEDHRFPAENAFDIVRDGYQAAFTNRTPEGNMSFRLLC